MGSRGPNWVKFDRFAIFELASRHNLRAAQCFLLITLVNLASYKTWEVTENLHVLADYAKMGRNQVSDAIKLFSEVGVVTIEEPFRPGSRPGRLFIAAYRTLVVPERNTPKGTTPRVRTAVDSPRPLDSNAIESPPQRVTVASISAKHQGEVGGARESRSEEVGERRADHWKSAEDRGGRCRICGGPAVGHPFSDHEPPKPYAMDSGGAVALATTAERTTERKGTVSCWPLADGSPPHGDTEVDSWAAALEADVIDVEDAR